MSIEKKKISFNIYVFGGPAVRSHMGTYAYLRNGASEEKNIFVLSSWNLSYQHMLGAQHLFEVN